MNRTCRLITYWKDNNNKAISYSTLTSNDEEAIIKWLYQQGIQFEHSWGIECHDIGDTDYFQGSIDTDDVDTMLTFLRKIYGEWNIGATYEGIEIQIKKSYPNIMHGLSFTYPKKKEENFLKLFADFEKSFCYPEIKENI